MIPDFSDEPELLQLRRATETMLGDSGLKTSCEADKAFNAVFNLIMQLRQEVAKRPVIPKSVETYIAGMDRVHKLLYGVNNETPSWLRIEAGITDLMSRGRALSALVASKATKPSIPKDNL